MSYAVLEWCFHRFCYLCGVKTKNNSMRKLRTGNPQPEEWDVDDIMTYLGCEKAKAKKS